MSKHKHSSWPKNDTDAQAVYWFTVLRSEHCTKSMQRAFEHWHRDHAAKYEAVVNAWDISKTLAQDPDILALRQSVFQQSLVQARNSVVWKRLAGGVAILFFAIMLVAGLQSALPFGDNQTAGLLLAHGQSQEKPLDPNFLSTVVGERSTMTLEDGSSIELNTDTEVRVQYSVSQRNIFLQKGQAIFKVAHNPDRPFIVYASGQKVTALGTEFEVRIDQMEVAVTLLQGKVKIDDIRFASNNIAPSELVQTVELRPGERFSTGQDGATPSVHETDVVRATSWREGRLIFKDETLGKIAYEINRYSTEKVTLRDETLSSLRISGSFKAGSAENFALALIAYYPVRKVENTDAHTIEIYWKKQ